MFLGKEFGSSHGNFLVYSSIVPNIYIYIYILMEDVPTDKSFSTQSDAEAFVAGKNPAKPSKGDKFYAVAVGHETGVYEEWADAKKQIDGVKGPKYKKFATREEAEEFVREGGKTNKKVKTGAGKEESGKKVVKGKDKVTVEEKTQEFVKGDTVKVWTDGSSRGNGKVGAVAGYGVFFGDGDDRYGLSFELSTQSPSQIY